MSGLRRWWFPALALCSGLTLWLAVSALEPGLPAGGGAKESPPPGVEGLSRLPNDFSRSAPGDHPRETDVRSRATARDRDPQPAPREPETVAESAKNGKVPQEKPSTGADGGGSGWSSQGAPATTTDAPGLAPAGLELVIPVPRGARIPAIFYDETPRPAPQQRALDRIARDFNEAVSRAAGGETAAEARGNAAPEADAAEIWRAAAERADQQYINLYGFPAWHELHLRGAKEALREKKAAQPR